MANTESLSEKRFRCPACNRTFTRNDHLKRHQLRHTGLKPYQCQFCNTAFSRSDSLRDHYVDCPLRGQQDIPATGSGGRRRHACTLCIQMKLKCDGSSPCSSCRRRNIECTNLPQNGQSPSPANPEASEHILDRGSIQFLLNGGTEGWVSRFQFPPTEERAAFHDSRGTSEKAQGTLSAYEPFSDMSSLRADDPFTSFFSGPFGFLTNVETASSVTTPRSMANQLTGAEDSSLGSEPPWVISLAQHISKHIPKDSRHREDLLGNLYFLTTTTRLSRAIDLYFTNWHFNARVISLNNFNPANVSTVLLAAVVIMGALYSPDVLESYAAKALLDFVELSCFDSETFSASAEINEVFEFMRPEQTPEREQRAFEDLQGCYLMVITQHWAGNKVARKRAMEIRFCEVVKVARKMGLTRCRQAAEDRISETLWLRKESRIRTMAFIILIDCALSFFQNYPCRLMSTELECDLPSDETLFDSEHPFSEPNFTFKRPLTLADTFERLFAYESDTEALQDSHLTVLDMFILIHLLYVHVNTLMTLLTPLLRIRKSDDIDQDSSVQATKSALSRWRNMWLAKRSKISEQDWAVMGFWKNGYNYWSIAQLMMSKKDSVDSIMRMDFGEDKLEKLKALLQDDSD